MEQEKSKTTDSTISTTQVFDNSYTQVSKKPPRLKMVTTLLALLFIVGSVFGYSLYNAPRTYAREYLDVVGPNISDLNGELAYFLGAFNELSDSAEASREAFYEITSVKPYLEAVTDTEEDIVAINATKQLIENARKTKAQYDNLPKELDDFNEALDAYLDNSDKELDILLTHQLFKQQLLEASGDDLNAKINELNEKVRLNQLTIDGVDIFQDISLEASAAVQRYEAITEIPDTEQGSYDAKLAYHQFIAQKFAELYQELSAGNVNAEVVSALFDEINTYVTAGNEQVRLNSERYVVDSDVVELFRLADASFAIMGEQIVELNTIFETDTAIIAK